MKLTPEEKRELLEDARDPQRREAFQRARNSIPRMSIEQSLHWLTETARAFRVPVSTRIVRYARILL